MQTSGNVIDPSGSGMQSVTLNRMRTFTLPINNPDWSFFIPGIHNFLPL